MKCPICGSENPAGASSCRRCEGPLISPAIPGARRVDPSAERVASSKATAQVPTRRDAPSADNSSSPPRLLVPKAERSAAPKAPGLEIPKPIETPASDDPPKQPPLPKDAPREAPRGDDVDISVHFDQTMLERGPKPPPGVAAKPTAAAEPPPVDLPAPALGASAPPVAEQHDTDPGGPPSFEGDPGADVDVTEPDAIAPNFDDDENDAHEAAPVTVAVHRQIKLAPIWRRVMASVIDLVLIALLSAVHLLVALARLPDTVGPARGTGFDRVIDAALVYADATLPTGAVFLALLVLYQTVFIALLGQTPGQVMLKLHVISRGRRRVSLGASFARGLIAALGLLALGIGWSVIFLSQRRRTLHDLLTGTYVGDATDEVLTSLPQPAAPEADQQQDAALSSTS